MRSVQRHAQRMAKVKWRRELGELNLLNLFGSALSILAGHVSLRIHVSRIEILFVAAVVMECCSRDAGSTERGNLRRSLPPIAGALQVIFHRNQSEGKGNNNPGRRLYPLYYSLFRLPSERVWGTQSTLPYLKVILQRTPWSRFITLKITVGTCVFEREVLLIIFPYPWNSHICVVAYYWS